MQNAVTDQISGAGTRIPVSSGEQVEVIDAEIVTRDGLRAGLCGDCGGTFDTDQMIEFTLRSSRRAQVTALLHGACALRLLEHTPVDLSRRRAAGRVGR